MNFKKEAEKLLTNKYFLYFIMFLSATNLLGYLVNYRFNSAIIFILIGLLMNQFSKNLVVVLLVALVITNLLAAMGGLREGLDGDMKASLASKAKASANNDANDAAETQVAADSNNTSSSTDPEVESAISAIKDKVKKAQDKKKETGVIYDHGSHETDNSNAPSSSESFSSAGKNKAKGKGPYIDHAATVEQSYQHLEDILGSDGIKNLTKDTQNLIEKQKKMYENIENMMPMVEQAQGFLKNFDLNKINDLVNVAGGKK